MFMRTLSALVILALAAAPVAIGQAPTLEPKPPTTPAPAPSATPSGPAADALKYVPAGCMGFLLVGNVQNFTGQVDAFIKQVSPPNQPLLPGSVLDLLKVEVRMGETFNPNGGFAVVLLDVQQYGYDAVGKITGKLSAAAPGQEQEIPLVLVIPGKDAAKMFASANPTTEGGYVKIPGEKVFWGKEVPGFVLAGPNKAAVDAVAATTKSVKDALSAGDKDMVEKDGLMLWVNLKVVYPLVDALLTKLEKDAVAAPATPPMMMGPEAMMRQSFGQAFGKGAAGWREMLKQINTFAGGVRFAATGVFFDCRVSYVPDSVMGKALAAYKHVPAPLLNRLPNMPYALALGAIPQPELPADYRATQVDQAIAQEPFSKLSTEGKAKARAAMLGLNEQMTGMQLYVGGLTDSTGQLGAAIVVTCKSSEQFKKHVAALVELVPEFLTAEKDPNLSKLMVKYLAGLETVDGKKVDVISIDHPELQTMKEGDRAKLKALLGEDKLRVLVGSLDDKTLVMTIGGGTKFFTQALETAGGTGKLEQDPNIAKALAQLPKDRLMAAVLSVPNILGIVTKAATAMGEPVPPLKMAPAVPFAGSLAVEKGDVLLTGYVPAESIREIITSFMGMMMGVGGPGMMPPPMEE